MPSKKNSRTTTMRLACCAALLALMGSTPAYAAAQRIHIYPPAGSTASADIADAMNTEITEATDAPDGETAAPDGETAAPEDETAAPEDETAAPEGETAAPEGEITIPEDEKAASEHEVPSGRLTDVSIILEPAQMAPGMPITVTARIEGVTEPLLCRAQWYIDGVMLPDYANPAMELIPGRTSTLEYPLTYTPDMVQSYEVGFSLSYKGEENGAREQRTAVAEVMAQNYAPEVYAARAIARISPDYTEQIKDYTQWEKTAFVNAKAYTSKTDYLIWISRAAQKVNIFSGSQGSWTLAREFPCATGLPRMKTPAGVTYVTDKQSGWYMASYDCLKVVRFYPNSGYAFHSQPLVKGTATPKEPAMGYPASHGCVRMILEDITWLHTNIPLNTTVVIY